VLDPERARFVTAETLHIDGGRQPDTDAGSDDGRALATVDVAFAPLIAALITM
jgi:hypothetical protein